jgi:hypothetical protein
MKDKLQVESTVKRNDDELYSHKFDISFLYVENIEGNFFNVKLSNRTHPCQLLGFILRMEA